MSITNTFKRKQNITNAHLLSQPAGDPNWFPIWRDGRLDNKDEFIELKMNEYGLRTRSLVLRALETVGVE